MAARKPRNNLERYYPASVYDEPEIIQSSSPNNIVQSRRDWYKPRGTLQLTDRRDAQIHLETIQSAQAERANKYKRRGRPSTSPIGDLSNVTPRNYFEMPSSNSSTHPRRFDLNEMNSVKPRWGEEKKYNSRNTYHLHNKMGDNLVPGYEQNRDDEVIESNATNKVIFSIKPKEKTSSGYEQNRDNEVIESNSKVIFSIKPKEKTSLQSIVPPWSKKQISTVPPWQKSENVSDNKDVDESSDIKNKIDNFPTSHKVKGNTKEKDMKGCNPEIIHIQAVKRPVDRSSYNPARPHRQGRSRIRQRAQKSYTKSISSSSDSRSRSSSRSRDSSPCYRRSRSSSQSPLYRSPKKSRRKCSSDSSYSETEHVEKDRQKNIYSTKKMDELNRIMIEAGKVADAVLNPYTSGQVAYIQPGYSFNLQQQSILQNQACSIRHPLFPSIILPNMVMAPQSQQPILPPPKLAVPVPSIIAPLKKYQSKNKKYVKSSSSDILNTTDKILSNSNRIPYGPALPPENVSKIQATDKLPEIQTSFVGFSPKIPCSSKKETIDLTNDDIIDLTEDTPNIIENINHINKQKSFDVYDKTSSKKKKRHKEDRNRKKKRKHKHKDILTPPQTPEKESKKRKRGRHDKNNFNSPPGVSSNKDIHKNVCINDNSVDIELAVKSKISSPELYDPFADYDTEIETKNTASFSLMNVNNTSKQQPKDIADTKMVNKTEKIVCRSKKYISLQKALVAAIHKQNLNIAIKIRKKLEYLDNTQDLIERDCRSCLNSLIDMAVIEIDCHILLEDLINKVALEN